MGKKRRPKKIERIIPVRTRSGWYPNLQAVRKAFDNNHIKYFGNCDSMIVYCPIDAIMGRVNIQLAEIKVIIKELENGVLYQAFLPDRMCIDTEDEAWILLQIAKINCSLIKGGLTYNRGNKLLGFRLLFPYVYNIKAVSEEDLVDGLRLASRALMRGYSVLQLELSDNVYEGCDETDEEQEDSDPEENLQDELERKLGELFRRQSSHKSSPKPDDGSDDDFDNFDFEGFETDIDNLITDEREPQMTWEELDSILCRILGEDSAQ